MATHLQAEATTTARSCEAASAGAQLDTALAVDQAQRERLQRKWSEKNRRLLQADHRASMGSEWMSRGIAAVGMPAFVASVALEVTSLQHLVPDDVRFIIYLGGPAALSCFFLVFVLENFARSILETARKVVVAAARAEGVELPSQSAPKPAARRRASR